MTVASESRQAVLQRIRSACAGSGAELTHDYAALPRPYLQHGAMDGEARLALMTERLREYDAEVVECAPDELPAAIAAQIARSGRHVLAAPPGLPQEWLAPGCEWRVDHGLTSDQLEQTEGVVTAATCGIADSGTIVLHHTDAEGRRALTLLPDWHLCVLRASQVVETLPEYFDRCATAPALFTMIAGPSATADIEMTRIKGVHGPRFLSVVLVRDDRQARPGADRTTLSTP